MSASEWCWRLVGVQHIYGAAPTMLVFAPDGGAGFDLMGQDSFDQILTSWNTTIAGPLGTSGAQNVNPPVPKCPMAVRATPWGRNGGDFEIFHRRLLHCCNNSTSGTRTATEVTDAWVKQRQCALSARDVSRRSVGRLTEGPGTSRARAGAASRVCAGRGFCKQANEP
jgi:hypothetical protein